MGESGRGELLSHFAFRFPASALPIMMDELDLVEYDIDDYKPGGVATEAAQEEGRYHYVGGDLKVSGSGEVLDGLYYVTGDVKLSGSGLSGEVTIVAQGRIRASGSNHSFTAYSGELLFFSQEGYGGQKGCSKAVIKVSGSGMVWDGVAYAPGGLIQVSGSNSTLKGRLIGAAINLDEIAAETDESVDLVAAVVVEEITQCVLDRLGKKD